MVKMTFPFLSTWAIRDLQAISIRRNPVPCVPFPRKRITATTSDLLASDQEFGEVPALVVFVEVQIEATEDIARLACRVQQSVVKTGDGTMA